MKSDSKQSESASLKKAFFRLYEIIALLRSPQGCPWDRAQTPETLRKSLIEEAYECIEAIDEKNTAHVREELGDLFLIIILIARMHEESNSFTLVQVLDEICVKLIRRHPHVFEKKGPSSIPDIIKNWDYIKEHIEGKKKKESVLAGITNALPPLEKALALQKKAASVGFDWASLEPVFSKLDEEVAELKEAYAKNDRQSIENEIGDILFTVVNMARHLAADPALTLEKTNRKFRQRFHTVEEVLRERHIPIKTAGLKLLDSLWNEAKNKETGA